MVKKTNMMGKGVIEKTNQLPTANNQDEYHRPPASQPGQCDDFRIRIHFDLHHTSIIPNEITNFNYRLVFFTVVINSGIKYGGKNERFQREKQTNPVQSFYNSRRPDTNENDCHKGTKAPRIYF
jgi:hypothetical protein